MDGQQNRALKPEQWMFQGLFFFPRAIPTFLGPFGLEKGYNHRVSLVKAVWKCSCTTPQPRRQGNTDFIPLDIINPWLFWAVGSKESRSSLSTEPPSAPLSGSHPIYSALGIQWWHFFPCQWALSPTGFSSHDISRLEKHIPELD